MFKFRTYDPEMPERLITDANAFDHFDDILRNDDNKIIRSLLDHVLTQGSVFMKVIFLEVISQQLEEELDRLDTAESEAQFFALQRGVRFVFSIEQQIALAVDNIVNRN